MRRYMLLCLALGAPAAAQDDDFENFHVEITVGWWLRDTRGTIQSGIVPVDLKGDLDIAQNEPTFAGRLVYKPTRRQRLMLEGIPYRLRGDAAVTRQFTFAGQRYTIQDRVVSDADITYIFGGYQFDIVSKPRGHFGLQAGVGYVNATGDLRDQTFGFSGTEIQTFPFPVAGAEFRAFPLPTPLLQISGELKGMSLGDYGHYLDGSLHVGAGIGRHLTLLVGYRIADADVHRQNQTRGITPRFGGPVFSLQVRR